MKSTDRTIVLAVAMLGLVAAFWFLVLAPKRQQASDLEADVATLQTQVTQAELAATTGEAAKKDFPSNYRKMITLGKAVPVDADTPSLLTQLQTLSVRSDVDFRSIALGSGTEAAPAPVDPAIASEASAALLPIGATVGSAGLPVMPYTMEFEGGFFEIADFFGRIDRMVDSHGNTTKVDGRLLTIDGFSFTPSPVGLPRLSASVTATSYLTPAEQGIVAGATPEGPPETGIPATTPSTESTPDPAVTAASVTR